MQEAAYATLTSQLHAYFETGQVADAYTNNLFYIGTRATGGKGGNHAFVGPDWKGTLPKDVTVVESTGKIHKPKATPGAPELIMSWFQPPAPRFVWSASYIRTQGKIALLEDGHYIWEDSDRRRIASQSSVPIADMRDRPTNY
jgi:hypothetical protein